MNDFFWALSGGALLGSAVVVYLYTQGRIAGVSGLLAQSLKIQRHIFQQPAFWFITGIILIPFIYAVFFSPNIELNASPWMMIIAGLLVGFGTRLGSGCTSGHGICGLSRLSLRSMIATLSFMLSGFITVFVIRHILGIMS